MAREDLKVGLLVAMIAGNGNGVCSMLNLESESPVPTLLLVNNTAHQRYLEGVIDNHILRSMLTEGHHLYNEVLAGEIQETFPSLSMLSGFGSDDADELEGEGEGDDAADADTADVTPDIGDGE